MYQATIDDEIRQLMNAELQRQRDTLIMIASENYLSEELVKFQGNVLTNKYAEGYPGKRYYQGNEFADKIEVLAIERAKALFGAEHANVQPHSGSQANMAAYMALIEHGDTVMAMDLKHGGHLTHGSPVNFSGKQYNMVHYTVEQGTEVIDYDRMAAIALEFRPKLIVTGATAYPRTIDFARWKEIADSVGAYLMADISHIAGLVAAGVHPSPFPHADIVTTTTHKTLDGPRGAIIMCKEQYAQAVDKAVFPGMQGGPLMHIIAAKAVILGFAKTDGYREYQRQVVKNAATLAAGLTAQGLRLVSGGTDNHLILLDVGVMGLTGKKAAVLLEQAGIEVNFNTIPYDERKPFISSGVRLGTPAVTNRGMKEPEMALIAEWYGRVLKNPKSPEVFAAVKAEIKTLCDKFPLYPNL